MASTASELRGSSASWVEENNVMGKRPEHVKPPAYLSKSPPIPEPVEASSAPPVNQNGLDPTRYGDWESKGIAIDF